MSDNTQNSGDCRSKRCYCRSCSQSKTFTKIKALLNNHPDLLEGLDQIQNDYYHESMELSYLQSIIGGTWPDSDMHMEKRGWVPKLNPGDIVVTHKYKSYTVKGELASEGLCKVLGETKDGFTKVITADGVVLHIGDGHYNYPKDSLLKIR